MQRYFVKNEQMTETEVTIVGEDVKHIAKVMRMSIGDQIICTNESGQVTKCSIVAITNEEVTANIDAVIDMKTELPVKVTVAQGLPKGDKLEMIVQKGTELGAFEFIPLQLKRSIVKWEAKKSAKKLERLEKIAKEAAEQSYRRFVPKINEALTIDQLIKESHRYDYKVVAYEEEAKLDQPSNLAKLLGTVKLNSTLLVVIGPEGGLDEKEAAALCDAGFTLSSFGPRILRTETAALYFLAAVSYHLEIMR